MSITFELPIVSDLTKVVKGNCGTCQECCMALKITELNPPKPMYHICRHQSKGKCSVYSKRPDECAKYECAYLSGLFNIDGKDSADYRPDKLGLIIDLRELDGDEFIQVWEVKRGLISGVKEGREDELSLRVNAVMTYLISKGIVMIRYFNGESISFAGKDQEYTQEFARKYIKACNDSIKV